MNAIPDHVGYTSDSSHWSQEQSQMPRDGSRPPRRFVEEAFHTKPEGGWRVEYQPLDVNKEHRLLVKLQLPHGWVVDTSHALIVQFKDYFAPSDFRHYFPMPPTWAGPGEADLEFSATGRRKTKGPHIGGSKASCQMSTQAIHTKTCRSSFLLTEQTEADAPDPTCGAQCGHSLIEWTPARQRMTGSFLDDLRKWAAKSAPSAIPSESEPWTKVGTRTAAPRKSYDNTTTEEMPSPSKTPYYSSQAQSHVDDFDDRQSAWSTAAVDGERSQDNTRPFRRYHPYPSTCPENWAEDCKTDAATVASSPPPSPPPYRSRRPRAQANTGQPRQYPSSGYPHHANVGTQQPTNYNPFMPPGFEAMPNPFSPSRGGPSGQSFPSNAATAPFTGFSDPNDVFAEFMRGSKSPADDEDDLFRKGQSPEPKPTPQPYDRRQSSDQDTIVEKPLPLSLEDLFKGCNKKLKVARKILDERSGKVKIVDAILNVPIKPGLQAGSKIKYADLNDSVGGGKQSLHFVTEDKPHPLFTRERSNLRHTIKITLAEASSEWSRIVPTLDGKEVWVGRKLPTPSTWEERFPGLGMPKSKTPDIRGDLIVGVVIVVA